MLYVLEGGSNCDGAIGNVSDELAKALSVDDIAEEIIETNNEQSQLFSGKLFALTLS